MKWLKLSRFSHVFDIFDQAIWSLRENRFRTTLSILGITVGIAAVMIVGAVSRGGHYLIFQELQTFGLKSIWVFRHQEEKDPFRAVRKGTGISNSDYEVMRSGCCPAVRRMSPGVLGSSGGREIIRAGSRYSDGHVEGVGFEYISINNDNMILGRPFREEDEVRRRPVIIIGPTVNADLFGGKENPVGKEIHIGQGKYTIIGVLEAKSRDFLASIGSTGGRDANNRILMPYTVRQQTLGTKEINYLQAETIDLDHTDLAVQQIVGLLERRNKNQFSYKVETMARYIDTTNRILRGVSLVGVVAASISLLVGGLGIMNIMSTSVLERTREIGLRKAVGAKQNDILFQFLMEAAMISTLGGLLGLTLGELASFGFTLWTGFPLIPSWLTLAAAFIVSVGVGLLSGYYPARRAARLRPVEALRYE